MTNLTIYREEALTENAYRKLDIAATEVMSFREREYEELYWDKDEYGDRIQRKRYIVSGPEIFKKGEITERLLQSLQRPAKVIHIGQHLAGLAAHKPWGRGEEAWAIVVKDLCNDLDGVSEYAIIKSIEKFRRDPELRFFPDTAVLLKYIQDLDWSLKNVKAEEVKKPGPKPEPEVFRHDRTPQMVRRVGVMCRLATKQKHNWTKWEHRFMEGIKKNAK